MSDQARDLAPLIDHTALKPATTSDEIRQLCAEAKQHGFASVCVNPTWIPLCVELLAGSSVKVCTVVGFPLGAMSSRAKAFEAENAVQSGAQEVDMVINVGRLKDGEEEAVQDDIAGVVNSAREAGRSKGLEQPVVVKVIIETALLTDDEKRTACRLAQAAGADFVKTSTGFSGGGATVEDITLMRETVGPDMGIKASGGVRTAEDARAMVSAGATRIGASSGVQIVQGGVAGGAY